MPQSPETTTAEAATIDVPAACQLGQLAWRSVGCVSQASCVSLVECLRGVILPLGEQPREWAAMTGGQGRGIVLAGTRHAASVKGIQFGLRAFLSQPFEFPIAT